MRDKEQEERDLEYMEDNHILKVLVGSRAHGLHTKDSDYDYRGVFITPLEELFKIGGTTKNTNWIEGKNDDTSWELGHFLSLATKCNPTILETFAAPVVQSDIWGARLRKLFPYIWHPQRVFDAFTGYGFNQRKKMLEDKDKRGHKYAAAYLRTLIQCEELLRTGTLRTSFVDHVYFPRLVKWKNGELTAGEVIDVCQQYESECADALKYCEHEPDLSKVDAFLLKARLAHKK